MKKIYNFNLLVLFLIIIINSNTYSQVWDWSYPKPSGIQLNDIKFINSRTGWAVGMFGLIMKTTDGGDNWVPQRSKSVGFLVTIYIVDTLNVWVFGNPWGNSYEKSPIILNTTDGGITWENHGNDFLGNDVNINFVDRINGWAVGSSSTGKGLLAQTKDGGNSWNIDTIKFSSTYLSSIYYIDSQIGWIAGSQAVGGVLFKTSDGGKNWIKSAFPITRNLNSVSFINMNEGWACGIDLSGITEVVLKTSDGGNNWKIDSIPNSGLFSNIFFSDSLFGYISNPSTSSKIYITTDGGSNWELKEYFNFTHIYYQNAKTGWGVGSFCKIAKTTDTGNSWVTNYPKDEIITNRFNSIYFSDSLNGRAVGEGGIRINTTDGGNTWIKVTSKQNSFDTINLTSIKRFPKGTWWMIGNGRFYNDSGGYFSPGMLDGNKFYFNDTQISDSNNCWAVSVLGLIYNNFDNPSAGFILNANPTKYTLNSLHFVNHEYGWVVGENNTIFKTTNHGKNWINQTYKSKNINSLKNVFFIDTLIGWIVIDNGTIIKTYDGGNSWIELNTNNNQYSLNNIQFVDNQHGFAVGRSGVLETQNGGKDWISRFESYFWSSVYALNKNNIWIASGNGQILKYRNIETKTGSIAINKFCRGDVVKIPYFFNGLLPYPIIIVAQISDSNGNFNDSPIIGTLFSDSSGYINWKIPDNFPFGNYKLRIWDSDNSISISIAPQSNPNIIGSNNVCLNNNLTYSVPTISGSINKWSIVGGKIIGDSIGNSVTVNWNLIGYGKISVNQEISSQSCHGNSSLNVKINENNNITNLHIDGETLICSGGKDIQTYSNLDEGTINKWKVIGGEIIGADTGTTVNVKWKSGQIDSIFFTQSIIAGSCTQSIFRVIKIDTSTIIIPEINGDKYTCENTTSSFQISKNSSYQYEWIAQGGTIVGNNLLDSVNVLWGSSGPANIILNTTNKAGCKVSKQEQIYLNGYGVKITGDNNPCLGDTSIYYSTHISGLKKKWRVTKGIIIGDTTADSVIIYWTGYTNLRFVYLDMKSGNGNCSNTISLRAGVQKNIKLTIPNLSFNPVLIKDKPISIPIIINEAKCLGLTNLDTITLGIKLRKTMFLPKVGDDLTFIDNGNDRHILLKIAGDNFNKSDSITTLVGYILIGDTTSSDIYFESISLSNNLKTTDTLISGKLSYLGIPNDYAGLRLMKRKEISITSIFPNPATDKINITIESSDKSENTAIEIYDMIGIKFLSRDIQLVEGTNHQAIEFGNQLESGMYYILLKGTENTETKNFVIGK